MPGVSPKPRPGSLLPHETRGDGWRPTQVGKGGPFEMWAGRSELRGLESEDTLVVSVNDGTPPLKTAGAIRDASAFAALCAVDAGSAFRENNAFRGDEFDFWQ